jgi:radical SAM superfamily enzyme YgiQ (UPF0313 family)
VGKVNRKLVEKADALLSKERGTVFKDPGGKISIALVYPNIYSVGMSSLGFQGIYGMLNRRSDVVCERVFLPEAEDIIEYARTVTEIFSLESKRSLSRFDIIAFSVSFENDYPNILKILKMSGIPLRSSARKDRYPLVIMGGVCAFYNPEPLAGFIDMCFIGEAEEMLPEFLSAYKDCSTRDELFNKALKIEGIYIPEYYSVAYAGSGIIAERKTTGNAPEVIRKRTFQDISGSLIRSSITSPDIEFSDMCLIEAMRGCIWTCRFCVAGHIYRPARKKDPGVLRTEIMDALSKTGRVGLIGPSLSDYPYIEDMLSIEGVDFSITSLRASLKSAHIVQLMKRHKSISIAPESGTERLRKVIDKRITEKDILETAELILESGVETLRLYFMIGLPTETTEDIEGIVNLVKKIRSISHRGHITLSISTFVPKPFTPFQWHPMAPLKDVKNRMRFIRKGLSEIKGVKVFHDVPKYAYMQGLLSVGDRRTSEAIEKIAFENPSGDKLGSPGFDPALYIFRAKEFSEILPWDFIDAGVSKEKLWKEYQMAVGL